MEPRRRSSLVLVAISIAVAVCAGPVANAVAHCLISSGDEILQSLKSSPAEAENLCRNHRAAKTVAPTLLQGQKTVTSTLHTAPTFTMTVARDYVQTEMTTTACEPTKRAHPKGPANDPALPVQHGGKRSTGLADHFQSFDAAAVSAACLCLMADEMMGETVTAGPTQTHTVPVVTVTYTMMDLPPVRRTVYLDATYTAYQTVCA